MRIDELDPKHKEFKEVILNHDLTEEQLDEILPAIGMAVGGLARVGAMAGGAALRGAAAVGRGLAKGVQAVGRGVGSAARGIGRGIKKTATNYVKNKINSIGTGNSGSGNTSGTFGQAQGTQGTIGTDQAQGQQVDLQRGQELELPLPDPRNPNKVVPTSMKVKNVTGREVEIEPKKKVAGQPQSIKFDKKDLAF